MIDDARFIVDKDKCIGCRSCLKVCAGMMLQMGEDGKPFMIDADAWQGRGCWGCQHCLAICPVGAISVEGKHPEDCPPAPGPEAADAVMRLMANRRSHRSYLDKNVDPEIIKRMLKACQNMDSGGCRKAVEFTVIDDKEYLKDVLKIVYAKMEELAAKGEYAWDSGKDYYDFMKASEKEIRSGDMLLCGAPHVLMIHQYWPKVSNWNQTKPFELGMATAYFEMLCAANGLGSVALSYIMGILEKAPELKKLFGLPEDHFCCAAIAFGYPDVQYARGVQRNTCLIETLDENGRTWVSGVKGGRYSEDEHLDELNKAVISDRMK